MMSMSLNHSFILVKKNHSFNSFFKWIMVSISFNHALVFLTSTKKYIILSGIFFFKQKEGS